MWKDDVSRHTLGRSSGNNRIIIFELLPHNTTQSVQRQLTTRRHLPQLFVTTIVRTSDPNSRCYRRAPNHWPYRLSQLVRYKEMNQVNLTSGASENNFPSRYLSDFAYLISLHFSEMESCVAHFSFLSFLSFHSHSISCWGNHRPISSRHMRLIVRVVAKEKQGPVPAKLKTRPT
jgi:hypothetical protein